MKVLHLADTHIGTRQYDLEARRQDFSNAFHQAIDLAIEHKVEAVIHAGDLFNANTPLIDDIDTVLTGLAKLKEVGIPFLGIVGNHSQKRSDLQWLDLFANQGLAVHLNPDQPYDLHGISVYGLDYSGRREVKLPVVPDAILVAHQLIEPVQLNAEVTRQSIEECRARFLLLGDYHIRGDWLVGHTFVCYPGSTERWSSAEREARSVNLIDLETNKITPLSLKTRNFMYVESSDILGELSKRKAEIEGSVVCIYLQEDTSIREIENAIQTFNPLAVRFIDKTEEQGEITRELDVSLQYTNIDHLVDEQLAKREFSGKLLHFDKIVRDLELVDSKVSNEIEKVLV